jgi:hypothetical protein
MDTQQPSEQADILFGAVQGVYGPQNTPMLWQCIIVGTKEHFEGHTHPHPPKKLHLLAWGVVTYSFEVSAQSARPHVEPRGLFLQVAATVLAVVTPVVFCYKATETFNKNTKTSCLYCIFV